MAHNHIPKQKISRRKKTKQWGIDSVKGFIKESTFSATGKHDLLQFYEAYNGHMNESDYNYVTNPYNTQHNQKRNFPARLRNYNIIKPVVDLLLGEKTNRPNNYMVSVTNEDAISKKEQEQKKL